MAARRMADISPEREAVNAAMRELSHDLRTPIVGIMGIASLALEPNVSGEDMRVALHAMLLAAQAMQRMMDGVAASRQDESLNGAQMTGELQAMIGRQAEKKRQRLTIDMGALGEGSFTGDAAAIWRVLLNLLTNAVKYTPEGGMISLNTSIKPERDGQVSASFVVRDSGVGMTPEFMRTMYEPNTRAVATAGEPGQGIGLSVVRELVLEMGGTVDATSTRGSGTVFTVCVPLMRTRPEPPEPLLSLTGERILIAEDNALCAQIETRLLTREGAVVTVASDGEQAAAHFAGGDAFDAVLLDLHMPGMDGPSAARAIRSTAAGRNVPIFAMTASTDATELNAAREAGMDSAITKPLNIASVRRALTASRRRLVCQ